MRVMMRVKMQIDAGNKAIKDGSMQRSIGAFLEQAKPEATYFTLEGGRRTAYYVFDMKDASMMPQLAEPFFSMLNAEIDVSPVMNMNELKAGLEKLPR